jgi:hypothetical protein
VGVVKKKTHTIGEVSLSALGDQWQRDATAAAITAMRGVVQMDGPIPLGTPVGRLSETELGWMLSAGLFAWISKRAEQATAEQINTQQCIRMTALDPQPWDTGAVAAILSDLADACSGLDWSKPLTLWPRDDIIEFLLKAMSLIRKAMIARDLSDRGITRQSSAATIACQANAAAGGPLMAPGELNDERRIHTMATDITGPDGGPLTLATHQETDAYRALREAEPPLLKFLRRHRAEVLHLCRLAHDALAQPHGRGCSAALEDIERRLSNLNCAMTEDIYLAELDAAAETSPAQPQ